MSKKEPSTPEDFVCKNCGEDFHGKFCPACGQSVKEFERPVQFMIIDFMGNMFAFDTRFWRTFVAVLFKPGKLALDYVKGHRVRYMPPFRFYVFVSFIFFFLLNIHTSQSLAFKRLNIDPVVESDSDIVADTISPDEIENTVDEALEETDVPEEQADVIELYNKHPELFFQKFFKYLSWGMFFLMPFYGFLLWLFFRKVHKYYITHFIMAINQHAFMFVVFVLMLGLSLLFPDFSDSFVGYLIFIIPVHIAIGYKTLYCQKTWKIILKLFSITFVYFIIVAVVAVLLVVLLLNVEGVMDAADVSIF